MTLERRLAVLGSPLPAGIAMLLLITDGRATQEPAVPYDWSGTAEEIT